ncbi:DUF6397 family protein [Streptomyces sp. NPDC060205]|uniref:DUF6397 family protein n=1 Tax=Streptomyces sp. NPDC060205 TaxID=3347072 RepID=UPI0036467C41
MTSAQASTLAQSRAARELGLKRGEFDLAVRLGRIRTVPDEGGGGHRVTREEIDRVQAEDGFPETLRERVKAVGTSEGAALMGVTTARFTRFARLGLVVPVKFYLNRYRAVVWLYLAEELRQFADDKKHAPLLNGRVPETLRAQLETGLDLRARNWRGRHLGFLLRQNEDPWARAAVVASLLDPVQVAEIVPDPYERAYMDRYRPEQTTHGAPDSPAALITARIMTATDPDEISWLRADLANGLEEARDRRAAPRPTAETGTPEAGHDRPTPPGEHRTRVDHRQPADLREAAELRHPAAVRRPAGQRRPGEQRRPAEVRHRPGGRHPSEGRHSAGAVHPAGAVHSAGAVHAAGATRPAAAPHSAAAPHPAVVRRPAEVRPAIDEPGRPGRLLGWLRRRNL